MQNPNDAALNAALQQTLVDLLDLAGQVKQAHWTVTGPNFRPVHLHLDEIRAEIDPWVDSVAERIATTGGVPDGRSATVAATSRLDPLPDGLIKDTVAVTGIADRMTAVTTHVREVLPSLESGDPVGHDLLLGVVEGLEKQRWMLRAQIA